MTTLFQTTAGKVCREYSQTRIPAKEGGCNGPFDFDSKGDESLQTIPVCQEEGCVHHGNRHWHLETIWKGSVKTCHP